MPKRPCSLAITASDSTIIYADKFGDVYSLPLLSPELPNNVLDQPENHEEAQAISEEPKQFFTAANDLTVHSARNRRALENQLRQNQKRAQKTELNPGQKLLLGHVSMLTDIALMERDGRSYIITADRDEHIRISRGMPQEHIIESYCLGHTEFVSRLCFPSPYPNLLISGGGDDNLLVWDWISGKLLTKTDLRSALENFQATANSQKNITPSRVVKFAVSTMRYVPLGPNMVNGSIVVSCEGQVFFDN
jgi:tRNA (guanine-N(7)-)-methyltransferase subunit TRM82